MELLLLVLLFIVIMVLLFIVIIIVLLFIDVLGGGGSDTESSSSGEADDDEDDEENEEEDGEMKIQDETQMNTMALRRTIYLTIMSSLSFEECAHKMLQMSIKPGQEVGGATAYEKSNISKSSIWYVCGTVNPPLYENFQLK